MIKITLNNINYEIQNNRFAKNKIKKIIQNEYVSINNFLYDEHNVNINKCLYCNNEIQMLKNIDIVDNKIFFNINKSFLCCEKGCSSFNINRMSNQYLRDGLGLSEIEIQNFQNNKNVAGCKTKRENGFYDDISNNPYSIHFWIKKGLSKEEAQNKINAKADKMILTKRENGFYDDISNNPYSIHFWIKKGLSKEEAQNKINAKNCFTKEYWMYRKGLNEQEASAMAKLKCNTVSIQYAKTFLYLDDADANNRYTQITSKMKNNVNLLSKFVNNEKLKKYRYSKNSQLLFLKLYKIIRKTCDISRNDIFFAINKNTKGEFFLYDTDNKKIYFYDFVIPKLKICIEFNGEHVHPRMDKIDQSKWKNAFTSENCFDVLARDERKKQLMIDKNFIFIIQWSQDSHDNVVQQIKEIANEYQKNQCK